MDEINELVPQKDERIILPDRGYGRDLGRNPTFDGTRQRKSPDQDSSPLSVGGYGERNDRVKSFAATAISFFGGGVIYNGAGALRGWSIVQSEAATNSTINIRNRDATGTILASITPTNSNDLNMSLGDFGVNFDSLYIEIVTSGSQAVQGTVWVASVE